MPSKPQILDYEPVFRSGARRGGEPDAQNEEWRHPGQISSDSQVITAAAITTRQEEASNTRLIAEREIWIRRRGHTVTFWALFLFTVILYIRPYEFFPGLSSFMSMAFYTGVITLIIYAVSQLMIEGNLTARPREIYLVLLLGLAALLSMPLAINPAEAWMHFSEKLLKAIVIFIVIVNVVRTERRLHWLILLALVVSVYLSVSAIYDYQAGIFKIGKIENDNLRVAGRIKGLFENSNDLALHLVTMAPIAFALAFARRGPVAKILYLGAAALMVGAIVVTFSRGGFLGLVAVAFVLVYKLGRNNRTTAYAGFALAGVLFFAVAPGDYAGRLSTIFNTASDFTGSATQRNQVLQRSVLVAMRYPLTGVGIGNFHHRSFRELGTHNAYTQVGSEMGVIAMVVYMMFLLAPLKRLRDIEEESRQNPEDRRFYYFAIGLQASLIGYMVSSFFAAVAYQWYVYYLVGYAICFHQVFLLRSARK